MELRVIIFDRIEILIYLDLSGQFFPNLTDDCFLRSLSRFLLISNNGTILHSNFEDDPAKTPKYLL